MGATQHHGFPRTMKEYRTRRELRRALAREVDRAIKILLDDQHADVSAELRTIRAYGELQDRQGAIWRRTQALALALVAAGLVACLWGLRTPRTRIILAVEAHTVSLRLATKHALTTDFLLDTSGTRVELLSQISTAHLLPAIPQEVLQKGEAWLEVSGGLAQLSRLELEASAIIELERQSSDETTVFVRNVPVRGTLLASNGAHLTLGHGLVERGDTTVRGRIPEAIEFTTMGSFAIPHMLTLASGQPLSMHNLAIDSLSFMSETSDGRGGVAFMSSIQGGRLHLVDVDREIDLRPEDIVTLTKLDGRVVRMDGSNSFSVLFEGSVGGVFVGPTGFRMNAKPSWLAYLYHQRTLALLWGAVVFALGTLWSVRRALFP